MRDNRLFQYHTHRYREPAKGFSLEIYKGFNWWRISVAPASYFDSRWNTHFSLTTILGLLALAVFGFNWIGLALTLIPWGQVFVHIPIYSGIDDCEYPEYGFYFYGEDKWMFDTFWIQLGKGNYVIRMPWEWQWVRTSALRKDGGWEHDRLGFRSINGRRVTADFWDRKKWEGILLIEDLPFRYVLKNGTVQERMASVYTDEMEWRWRAFKWLPWPRLIRLSINISFDGEVGERTGSWKGGTTGCSWRRLPGETQAQALMHMQIYRKFN